MKLYRFQVGDIGIYEAVDRDCPRDDKRRASKPDGSWLPKIGNNYPGAISFWKEFGRNKYEESGLKTWHKTVVLGEVQVIERSLEQIEVLYEDEFQVIGNLKAQ